MSASMLKATIWSSKSASRISAISGLCECQQAKSHSLVFESASRIDYYLNSVASYS